MFSKLKQFKDIRDRAKSIQAVLGQERVQGTAGWDKIKVVVDGNQHVVSVSIDESLMNDKAKLEGLIKEAANDALNGIQKVLSSKMKDLGGLDLAQDMQQMMKK